LPKRQLVGGSQCQATRRPGRESVRSDGFSFLRVGESKNLSINKQPPGSKGDKGRDMFTGGQGIEGQEGWKGGGGGGVGGGAGGGGWGGGGGGGLRSLRRRLWEPASKKLSSFL